MIEKGYDVTEAKDLLRQLELILDQWHVRRRLMLDAPAHRSVIVKNPSSANYVRPFEQDRI
ncbi:hypothetical protein DC522_06930 [Microvirga sp. KLBC 81]|uniref:hypothetical protein n=1 Tax=Microvirga sp. KLBC 81 TaxID=1862707 RepID=UPI000D516269|nr:hypothetical protein [Microvirga sp. KLBC 81]PVE25256.1 hypothetical protein DC522_06930 [Microvirga sp. KLBC 81]